MEPIEVVGDDIETGPFHERFPPSCAAALAGIEVIEREGLLERGRRLERIAFERLLPLTERFSIVGDVA